MGKFSKKTKDEPTIPTSALPDIIFILLFFFMVATVPREDDSKVKVEGIQATQVQAVPEGKETINLYLGVPKDTERFGSEPVIDAGGKFIPVSSVRHFVSTEVARKPMSKRKPSKIIVNIIGDKGMDLGIVSDVKEELREIGFLQVNYRAAKKTEL